MELKDRAYEEIKTYLVDDNEATAYNVHFKRDIDWSSKILFHVYPVILWKKEEGQTGIAYKHKIDDGWADVFNAQEVLMKFYGSICWRGDWESRIYFTDEEYWGDELEEMHKLFIFIKSHCKSLLR